MRDIKFRGKRIDNREWVYGGYDAMDGNHTIFDHESITHSAYEVDPTTVGQYVGRKDKNGREIYGGDITRGDWYVHGEAPFSVIGIVEYFDGWCAFIIHDTNMKVLAELNGQGAYHYSLEVLGNRWDNPELLKEE